MCPSPLWWAGPPLTYDGGEAAGGFVPSHQLVEFRVVKLQALQERHVSSLPFSVQDVEQAAWQRRTDGVIVEYWRLFEPVVHFQSSKDDPLWVLCTERSQTGSANQRFLSELVFKSILSVV